MSCFHRSIAPITTIVDRLLTANGLIVVMSELLAEDGDSDSRRREGEKETRVCSCEGDKETNICPSICVTLCYMQ